MRINFVHLGVSIGISLLAGVIGSIFTYSSIPTWYADLNKPFFNPPNSVFGPVWTLLYILMGVSLTLVWDKKAKQQQKNRAYVLFAFQLLLNTLWSIIFFGLQYPLGALLSIFILWWCILLTIIHFYKISKPAAYLLVPYILWVSFATVLNAAIVFLN